MTTFAGSKNFTVAEVACKCGCGMVPEQDFMDKVQMMRDLYGRPLRVTSGARCSAYNAKVSGTGEDGPHTTGRAIDFGIDRGDAYLLLRIGMKCGMTGIGVAQKGESRFLHFDDLPNGAGQPRPTVWSY